ncbi:phage portal protein [Paenibacillus chondroitinus]|uniref:Phage portal protein n=1 Tax=Paenibacillus chondroitinus TaxID=59842 RepID=A0ABU6D7G3_9BACL|nr:MULTISPECIES: phage portal protein [Paenibacillus]MCY9658116.1 phage portal protein [Paenibacillus anseongense]MEB4793222.1 phage portal protein [Paenibacillus chondroitinus]
MSDISVFFASNVDVKTQEDFIVSPRFKDTEGKPVPWVIQSVTEEENDTIRKSATKRTKVKGQLHNEVDQVDYIAKLVVASVSFPNLKAAELQQSYGVMGAEALVKKMLLSGEYAQLIMKVQEINGFDRDMNDLVEDAKN